MMGGFEKFNVVLVVAGWLIAIINAVFVQDATASEWLSAITTACYSWVAGVYVGHFGVKWFMENKYA